ncbi:hypothetical protein ES332_D04G120400v1 [Gossypium tomentosum]|uniref:Uncharacterized protein n=1 Tax=Gossypium tomentosum TaxID=34277 RepID=A0A5D2LD43_GOSTO|nr:hypothetical protein ES332_D04G120400v1 [Gossypium tomentosum]
MTTEEAEIPLPSTEKSSWSVRRHVGEADAWYWCSTREAEPGLRRKRVSKTLGVSGIFLKSGHSIGPSWFAGLRTGFKEGFGLG